MDMENLEPFPMFDFTVMLPPILERSFAVMTRPRPVPPKVLEMEAFAWVNGRKMVLSCEGLMPMPVSATCASMRISLLGETSPEEFMVRVTLPSLVNLTAFPRMLVRICCSLSGSPTTRSGTPLSMSTERSMFFS